MKLNQQQLEAHLWGAANILRGKTAGQDYKNYILSLMFFKRLCDQWECEADDAIAELERQQGRVFTEQQKGQMRLSKFDLTALTAADKCKGHIPAYVRPRPLNA